jgi:uncharacterized protein with HEPN domain
MSRDFRLFLEDILASIDAIESYVAGASRATLESDAKTRDAVIRCLEVIGEAVKALPPEICARHPDVHWSGFARMRDILIHQYFGVDLDIVWDTVKNELPLLEEKTRLLLSEEDEPVEPGS